MTKAIIVISGDTNGKTRLGAIAREEGYWSWHTNSFNFLGKLARDCKWNGIRDQNYFDFIESFDALVNKHFGFKFKYFAEMIEKFKVDPKPQLLIIHGCGKNLASKLQQKFEAFTLHILAQPDDTVTGYDHVLVVDENYEENVKRVLRVLTKENIENSGEN